MGSCDGRQRSSRLCETNCRAQADPLPKTDSHVLSVLLPTSLREKQNTLTHPEWLFTWPSLDVSSVFLPAERGHLTALSCWMMHYSLPVSLTLCVVSGHHTPWMIHPLVCSQKENRQNKPLAGGSCSVWCQRLRWAKTPEYTYDLFCLNLLNKRSTCWDFPGSFPVR